MSSNGKRVFLVSCFFSVIVIYKVHNYQQEERQVGLFLFSGI